MKNTAFHEFSCSIARTLDVVGEWWTLLILRDLFAGMTRYDEIQRDLGLASNVLAARLKRLLEAGLIERENAPDDGRAYNYRLSAKGRDLYPVMLALLAWGDKWQTPPGAEPLLVIHTGCGKLTVAQPHCACCGEPMALEDIRFAPGPGGRTASGTARMHAYLSPKTPQN